MSDNRQDKNHGIIQYYKSENIFVERLKPSHCLQASHKVGDLNIFHKTLSFRPTPIKNGPPQKKLLRGQPLNKMSTSSKIQFYLREKKLCKKTPIIFHFLCNFIQPFQKSPPSKSFLQNPPILQ